MKKTQSTNIIAQCDRLESYIKRTGSATTVEARHELDIVSPAARIFQLRHERGLNIVTAWVNATNPYGGVHRFAKYILKAGKYKAVQKVSSGGKANG